MGANSVVTIAKEAAQSTARVSPVLLDTVFIALASLWSSNTYGYFLSLMLFFLLQRMSNVKQGNRKKLRLQPQGLFHFQIVKVHDDMPPSPAAVAARYMFCTDAPASKSR
jgi:hypothetical protein